MASMPAMMEPPEVPEMTRMYLLYHVCVCVYVYTRQCRQMTHIQQHTQRKHALVHPRVDERPNHTRVVHGDGAPTAEHERRLAQGAAGLFEERELLLPGQLLAVGEVLDALHHLAVVLLHQLRRCVQGHMDG